MIDIIARITVRRHTVTTGDSGGEPPYKGVFCTMSFFIKNNILRFYVSYIQIQGVGRSHHV